jgi:hypothetical protein
MLNPIDPCSSSEACGIVMWSPTGLGSLAPVALLFAAHRPLSWAGFVHCLWLCLANIPRSWHLIYNILGSPLYLQLHLHNFMQCSLRGTLQGSWCCYTLPGLLSLPFKSQWKPLWPYNSCILHAWKNNIIWMMPRSATSSSISQPPWTIVAGLTVEHEERLMFWGFCLRHIAQGILELSILLL